MEGFFEDANVIHRYAYSDIMDDMPTSRDCLRFCFMHLLKSDLDAAVHLWNTHKLRKGINSCGGVPNELYMLPFLNGKTSNFCSGVPFRYLSSAGTHDYTRVVDSRSLTYAREYSSIPPPPVSLEFLRAADVIMNEHNITSMPTCISEALHLYSSTMEQYIN